MVIAGSLGFDQALNKFVPRLSEDGNEGALRFAIRRLLGFRFAAQALLSGILFVFRSDLAELFGNQAMERYLAIIALYVLFLGISNFLSNILISRLDTRFVFLVNTATRVLNISIVTILLMSSTGLSGILIVLTAVTFGSLAAFLVGARSFLIGDPTPMSMKPLVMFGLANWVFLILGFALGKYSDMLMLSGFLGAGAETGYYDMAYSLTTAIEYMFSMGFMGVALSVFSELAATDFSRLRRARVIVIQYQQALIIPAGLFCFLNSYQIITLLTSPQFAPADIMFRVFLGFKLIVVTILGGGVNTAVLLAAGKEKWPLITRAITGVLNLISNYFVIPKYGALGAITVTGFFALLTCTIEFVLVSRTVGLGYDIPYLLKVFLVAAFSALCVGFLPSDGIGWLIIETLLFAGLVVGGYYIIRLFDSLPQEVRTYIRNALSGK